jgi:hypothetical protein
MLSVFPEIGTLSVSLTYTEEMSIEIDLIADVSKDSKL